MIAKTLSRIGVEVWKDIPEYEDLYQVSNLGNVRSLNFNKTKKVKLLKKSLNSNGRYRVGLSKNGKSQG
ncbi:NUMOD4 domain-containing protein, partial [Akkermansiaceae bacterium]|nr:NUMOD4 domain-containing protein [Akkermansiaceae bacterium]